MIFGGGMRRIAARLATLRAFALATRNQQTSLSSYNIHYIQTFTIVVYGSNFGWTISRVSLRAAIISTQFSP